MTDPFVLSRPQPVGILAIPTGLLVLPGCVDGAGMQQCVTGQMGSRLPSAWTFYENARQGDFAAALADLAADVDPIAGYNRFVLDPTVDGLEFLRTELTGTLGSLLEIAAYTHGLTDEVPSEAGLDGELLALALMTQAASLMGEDAPDTSPDAALALLDRAISAAHAASPLFTAHLHSQVAGIYRTLDESAGLPALPHYRQAIALVEHANLPEFTADLWMQVGMICQGMAMGRPGQMAEAVRAYQEVLRSGLAVEEHGELFALAHNNLGLLYLSIQMTEDRNKLRTAIAVQSFREAVRVCNRELHPDLWASIQLNLANALQYMPSSHPEENLVQAVELYEELVTVRKKAFDPVGYGRILSNQANALAHLGIFSPALEKLNEARKLFEWHNETELATSAMELAGHIHEQVATTAGGN